MKTLIVVIGKSASGKDTLTNKICKELNIQKVMQITTRPKRENETDGVDYKFVTQQQMLDYVKQDKHCGLTSYDVVGDTWYYTYLKEDIEKHDVAICIANPKMAKKLKNLYPKQYVDIFVEADMLARVERSFNRDNITQVTAQEIIRRLRADEEDFANVKYWFKIDNTVDGYDEFKTCVESHILNANRRN